jgi:acyl-CoA synthetase (AMP-forming)/AMP-acid ligase II
VSELVDCLASRGDHFAVATETQQLTYRELAERVAAAAGELGNQRRLVLLETRNDIPTLVHYLAALAGDHAVLPVPAGRDHTAVLDAYDPDVVVDGSGVHERRVGSGHTLHDDLALLLSTSGSTGSPKLVRLSRTNLIANSYAIAGYLDIRQTDRAATTLPMSYCYGLSVIHSHLLRGAGIILTDRSVVDDEFWELFRRHRGTTFAGVPYTFELLERIGFDAMDLPALRYITQAGGRLAPERVRRFAALGQRMGWRLFVMYGATEATARMAYLPPELALPHPTSIGRAIPGGSFTIEPLDGWDDASRPAPNVDLCAKKRQIFDHKPTLDGGAEVGELVYRGPNVMMGYAQVRADLALGKTVHELRTGDIAHRGPDGLYEVIGRASRFVKLYGLRIDLQRVETSLAERGVSALCTDYGDGLAVAATGQQDERDVQRLAAGAAGLPLAATRVVRVDQLPMLPSGKPDYRAVRELARRRNVPQSPGIDLRELFAEVLQIDPRTVTADSSFVDLGGNSLSYVTMSVRLERALGRLPADWQKLPLYELERMTRPARRTWRATLETSVALRAVAIVLVVGSHASLFELWGGAHILLGVAGYNFGRFCLTPVPRADRMRHLRNTIGWIAVPSIAWIAITLVITDDYHPTNLLLLNKFLGPDDSMTAGRLWFVEVLVWILVALAVVCWWPAGDRLERRYPFGFATAFLAAGLALRYDVLGLDMGREAWFTVLAFWFFAAGWTAAKASTAWQRIAVTVVLIVGLYGYFGNAHREALVLAGFALLIWLPAIRCPAGLTVVAGAVAEASLFIYLTHFQVYELFDGHPLLGVIASVAVGVLITQLVSMLSRRVRERMYRSAPAPGPVRT